jgi:hypothetical protein
VKTKLVCKSVLPSPLALLFCAMLALTAIPAPSAQAQQVDSVEFTETGHYPHTVWLYLSTTTPGATIFYRTNGLACPGDPTHNGSTPTNGTNVYTGSPLPVAAGSMRFITALAYKAGMTDSIILCYQADNRGL